MFNKIFLLLAFFLLPLSIFSQEGKVVKVKDGDTIVILDNQNVMHTVRVADIDCPEYGQPFSKKAKIFVSNEIFGKHVIIKSKGLDKYNRIIGFVFYQDKNLSLELLRNGLAWHYSYFSNDKEMASLQEIAKNNKVGLWIDSSPVEPYKWRKGRRK